MTEKALCAKIQSRERMPQQRGQVSPSCRQPFWLGGEYPPEGIYKGKICNHNSKAKRLCKSGRREIPRERKDKTRLHQGPRSELHKALSTRWLCTFYQASSDTSKELVEMVQCSTLAEKVSGHTPPPGPCYTPRNTLSSCWQHL
jgi:hypothetical protein